MDVRVLDDVDEFADAASGVLRRDPISANVVAVELDGVRSGRRRLRPGSAWIVVEEHGAVTGVAMHTPPFDLFLPRLDGGAAAALADELWRVGRSMPGVTGEVGTVGRFCERWQRLGGTASARRAVRRMYVLGTLRPPMDVPGRARRATADDRDLVVAWLRAFAAETGNGTLDTDADEIAARRLAHGQLWLWEDGRASLALAGVHPAAAGVARIGPVYTSPPHRRTGYGSAVTARATQAALDAGAGDVVLYADLGNPTSNAVYQRLGYEPDHDCEERGFVGI